MLKIEYQLSKPGWCHIFHDMIIRYNNSNDSRYISLIPNLFDFKTNTINLKLSTLTMFKAIIEFNEENPIANTLFEEVLKKCKSLYESYIELSDLE